MLLNCEVMKKVATTPPPPTPISTSTPPFQVYSPFLAKNFETPQVTQYLEGGWKEGGGHFVKFVLKGLSLISTYVRQCAAGTFLGEITTVKY